LADLLVDVNETYRKVNGSESVYSVLESDRHSSHIQLLSEFKLKEKIFESSCNE